MAFFGLFKGSIKINMKKLDDNHFYFLNNRWHRINTNAVLNIPEGVIGLSCYRNKPCDVLMPNEYRLNGTTLPQLFTMGKYDREDKIKRSQKYFYGDFWFVKSDSVWLEYDINSYKIKDKIFGTYKVNFKLRTNLVIVDVKKFFKCILASNPKMKDRKIINFICDELIIDFKKFLRQNNYSVEDLMYYTKNISNQIFEVLYPRFITLGIEIKDFILEDIVFPAELVREVTNRKRVGADIHNGLKDFELTMQADGYAKSVDFVRAREQTDGSILEKYNANTPSDEMVDESEYYNSVSVQGEDYAKYDSYADEDETSNNQMAYNQNNISYEQPNNTNSSETKLCKNCYKNIPNFAQFCPFCGYNSASSSTICTYCGTENLAGSSYCLKCGKKLF